MDHSTSNRVLGIKTEFFNSMVSIVTESPEFVSICEDCSSSIYMIEALVETEFVDVFPSKLFFISYNFCIECDEPVDVLVQKTISTMIGEIDAYPFRIEGL